VRSGYPLSVSLDGFGMLRPNQGIVRANQNASSLIMARWNSWSILRTSCNAQACEEDASPRSRRSMLLKQHERLADHFHMRRVVVGGLGIFALGWALGSSEWRDYWSEFWTTAHSQLRASADEPADWQGRAPAGRADEPTRAGRVTENRTSLMDTSASTRGARVPH